MIENLKNNEKLLKLMSLSAILMCDKKLRSFYNIDRHENENLDDNIRNMLDEHSSGMSKAEIDFCGHFAQLTRNNLKEIIKD